MHPRNRHALAAALAFALAGTGCFRPGPATVPLRTLDYAEAAPGARCLVVFLPGRGDGPEDYARHGFPRRLRESGSGCAAIGVDAHLGYYFEGSIVDRLREDVIAPARARGEEIWLVGISLGALGSLLYARDHPGEVAGIVALAPFLGPDEVVREVAAGGGLGRWRPAEPPERKDLRGIWAWLGGYAAAQPDRPPLFLGWGKSDSFARANRLAAEVLPPGRVFTVEGGHTWRAWRRLWEAALDTGELPGTAGALPRTGGRR
jgi:pimeloyl-ACP methyl ester carboxylesterase